MLFDVDISNDIKAKENPLINFNSLFLVVWSGETKHILQQMNILDLDDINSYSMKNNTNITIYENDNLQSEFDEESEDVKDSSIDIIEQMLILLNDLNYDKDEVENMKNRLAKINIKYLQTLKEKDIKIKLINSNLTDEPEFSDLKHQLPPCWVRSGKTWRDVPGYYLDEDSRNTLKENCPLTYDFLEKLELDY
ncbi:anthrax toxin lethal factor-related metalloendopeptidase [Clostridioides sp. ZZV15-6383]|uniref:anthrax toxin lethal factor-related metalloendopeptidase n=1 Tax=Clostridioides sp. ZZV15-6383 TaxID=2811498 RepID=UPI0039BD8E46